MVLELFKKEAQVQVPSQPPAPAPQPAPEQAPVGPEPIDISVMQESYQGLVKMLGALQVVVMQPYPHHGENPEQHKQELQNMALEVKKYADELVSSTKKL